MLAFARVLISVYAASDADGRARVPDLATNRALAFELFDGIDNFKPCFHSNAPWIRLEAARCDFDASATKVCFQIEHTLVKAGGKDASTSNAVLGKVEDSRDGSKYLVRVVDRQKMFACDVIIEYSYANIVNIKSSGSFSREEMDKVVYVPPLLFDYSSRQNEAAERPIGILTTFLDETQPRRQFILRQLREKVGVENVNDVRDEADLKHLLDKTKILLNVHQTEEHHTFEDFRVLPALLRGVIVISEDVPLRQKIPYHKYIIWCSYDEMPQEVTKASSTSNYQAHFNRIHGGQSRLKELLANLKKRTKKAVEKKVRVYTSPHSSAACNSGE